MGTVPPGLAAWQASHKKKGGKPSLPGPLDKLTPGDTIDTAGAVKGKGKGPLPKTPSNNAAIVARIENKLGPVGKGHHNSHRTAALLKWLKAQEANKGKK